MNEFVPITVAYGDGVGPEIMHSVLRILKEAKARIRVEIVEIGENLYRKYYTSGIAGDSLENLGRTRWLLKGPVLVPSEEGYIDFTDSLTEKLDLHINVHNITSCDPNINLKIINAKSHDKALNYIKTYTPDPGDYKLYNVENTPLKISFDDLTKEHIIITEKRNHNDILSILSQLMPGQVRIGSKASIGSNYAIFEATHDAAVEIAGQNIANPSSLLWAAITMLKSMAQADVAKIIEDSWRQVIAAGIHTSDIYEPETSKKLATTTEFTAAIVDRILESYEFPK